MPEKKTSKMPEELLVIGRIERLLMSLDDPARHRVMAYLTAKHAPPASKAHGCNTPPMSPLS